MYIRLSRETDKYKINELLGLSFGDRNHCGSLDNLTGRYLLAFLDDKLVGMTGLIYSEQYKGYEVDWTCTHPDYRCKGIMHELFSRLCSLTDEIMNCSCWRQQDKDRINLNSLMRDFGFKEVMKPRVTWDSRYNCECGRTGYKFVAKAYRLAYGMKATFL